MSTFERLFKEMGKGPVHLVFGVAVNQGYRTVFGMEKIDQGRHEGALFDPPAVACGTGG